MRGKRRIAPFAVVIMLSVYYFSGTELFSALLLSIAVHELGHIASIYLCGGKMNDFSLEPWGFAITGTGIISTKAEIAALLSGPLAGIVFSAAVAAQSGFLKTAGTVSLLLSVYNLLPALPLDGGRALECILNLLRGEESARRILDATGVLTGTLLCVLGTLYASAALILGGIWVLLAQTGIVKSMRVL